MARIASFYAELRRRNVLRAGVFYAACAWLLVQVATQVSPFFHVPEWAVRWIIIAAVIGFPFAVAFAWFYEWTPRGFQPEAGASVDAPARRLASRRLDRAIIVVLALAVVALVTDRFVLHRDAVSIPAKSIAVLPLVNESGDTHNEYFSDGLTDELIAELARIPGLTVMGRSASFHFKGSRESSRDIGAKLGVATLLEGTVRRADKRVRIVVELINAADGRDLWNETFDRELDDIFAIQSGIAQGVAKALRVKLFAAGAPAPVVHHVPSFETYDHYLRGQQLLQRGSNTGFGTAVEAFRQAVALDPAYADAYAGLAMAESFAVEDNPDPAQAAVVHRRAMAAAERAVALDPELGSAYAARGYLRGANDWNWDGALADLKTALRLDPQDARNQIRYGYLLAALGRLPEAAAALRKGTAEDPLFTPNWYWLGRVLAAEGDYVGARRVLNRALAIDPEFLDAPAYDATLSLLEGDAATALAIYSKLHLPGGVAMAQHALGHAPQAKRALDRLIAAHARNGAYRIAQVYAWSNNADQAFAWLDRAVARHDAGLVIVKYDPLLRNLRADPRFNQLLAKLGLPPEPAPAG